MKPAFKGSFVLGQGATKGGTLAGPARKRFRAKKNTFLGPPSPLGEVAVLPLVV